MSNENETAVAVITAENVLDAAGIAQHMSNKQKLDLFRLGTLQGRQEMARAVKHIASIGEIQAWAEAKESEIHRTLKGLTLENGTVLNGTWEEYCRFFLGASDDKINDNIKNLADFGPEALEAMRNAGVGYREMRQLRALPDDERQALVDAAGDKETLMSTAEELLSRHRKEKKLLKETLGGMKADLEAKEKILDERNKELLSTKDKLVFIRSSKRIEANAIRSEVAGLIVTIRQNLTVQLNEGFTRLLAAATENTTEDTIDILQDEVKAFMAEQVMYMRMAVARLQEDFDLPDDPAEVGGPPAWMSADMDALEADLEAQKPEHLKSSAAKTLVEVLAGGVSPVEQISADDKAGRTAGRRKPAVVAGTEA